ncbi:hypothetical protein [Vibrio variabilis]|uniref:hypothetical protein n=1 Tax=Vibrio variabilis TaxID=990271 RepID=UPI000DD934F2|nr:hypothetical protein [Vibrio variabilis]
MIKNRIAKLEKLSSHNKTHRISQQDCLVMTDYEGCTPETCKHGCWLSESEYNAYMKQNGHLITEWEADKGGCHA